MTFYGGVSTQRLLPKAAPAEVKVKSAASWKCWTHGGDAAAPTHAIPDDVPVENILAFLEVVRNQAPVVGGR